MGTVVVLGSIITDLIARAPRLPHPGEALIGDEFGTFLGGKGINQAIAAARMGARVTMIGRVGTDAFGDPFFPLLAQEGIADEYVIRDPAVGTGVSLVVIAAETGQNMIVVNPRANLAVTAASVEAALRSAKTGPEGAGSLHATGRQVFLTQCETSTVSYTSGIRLAHDLGMLTMLNAAPIPREPLDDALFSLLDILIVNEVEAAALAGVSIDSSHTAQRAAKQLLARGSRHVIITLGAAGALWSERQETGAQHQMLPTFPVKAVDSTGAGDSFCGTLAAGLSNGMNMQDALRRASAAGALATTRMGAIAALPTSADVEALLTTKEH